MRFAQWRQFGPMNWAERSFDTAGVGVRRERSRRGSDTREPYLKFVVELVQIK